jgi:chaperonin GroEL
VKKRWFVNEVAVILVGGTSEAEVRERRTRLEEALRATRSALAEGVVAGGGVAMLKASSVLEYSREENGALQIGADVVRRALQALARQIAANAGMDGDAVVRKILENGSLTYGLNAQTKQYVDLVEAGIINPTQVVRTSLQEAAEAAGLLITTETAIIETPLNQDDTSVRSATKGDASDDDSDVEA